MEFYTTSIFALQRPISSLIGASPTALWDPLPDAQ